MKILITGNGFDIAHSLPTAYSNFINTIKIIKKANKSSISTSYSNYFTNRKSFNEIEDETLESIFDREKILELKKLTNNFWLDFFITEYEFETWIDFETKLENTLKIINEGINNFNRQLFNVKDLELNNFINKTTLGAKEFKLEIFKKFNLILQVTNTNEYKFNGEFCYLKHTKIVKFNEEKYFEYLLGELEKFINIFDLYLITFVEPIILQLKEGDNYKLVGVYKHFTFNYTNTFVKLYNDTIQTYFLHGKISDENKPNNIVLGFNDVFESVNNIKNFIPFTKYFQKLNKNTDYEFFKVLNISSTTELTIYFWGHSLDQSDKVYIEEVFNVVKNKKVSVKIFYHSYSSKSKILVNLISMFGGTFIVEMQRDKKLFFLETTNKNLENELNIINQSSLLGEVFKIGIG